jgi:lipopolysaccharide/colanic/teichoic acid biosynthesis glycosyltransferase
MTAAAVVRRGADVVVAGTLLAVAAPLLAICALAVRLTSPGPALFRQVRAGEGGRPFALLKLRTMRVGAGGPCVTQAADPRITRVGAALRRWKLDELPQLWNVVRGDMTLVGPRPEMPAYLDAIGALGRAYCATRPGLADPATLAFYDEAELLAGRADPERHYLAHILPEKARLSVAYARERTLRSDAAVLWSCLRRIAGARRPAATTLGDRHA